MTALDDEISSAALKNSIPCGNRRLSIRQTESDNESESDEFLESGSKENHPARHRVSLGAPDNHHEWVRKRLRRMDEKIDTIIYSLSMLDGKPFNVEKEKKRNYSVSAKQNSTPVGGWDAINKQASQMFGKIGAKCPKLERSKNRTSRGKLSAEGQNSEVSSEETSCVLTESVVSSEVVEKEPAIHRKQTPRSSKLSLPRLEKPKLPKIIPKSTLLLPEHILITGIEILYLLVIVGEALVVTTSFSMYKFHSDPPIQEVLWFTFATIVNLVFVLSRFCSAKLVGWQLIDDDARAIRNIYFRSWFVFDIGFGFPYDILAYLSSFILLYRVMQVVRCLKLFRAGSLFRPSNPLYNRRYVPFLSFCWVVIIHHGIACVHMLIRRKNSNIDDYIESIYWSVQSTTSVGYGDITDLNSREIRCYSVFVMLVGSGFYGWLLGNVSSYFMSQDIFMQKQNEMRSMLLSLMTRYDVSLEIQKEAMCIYPLILGDTANNFTEILELFPPYMQEKISLQVRLKLLRQVPMFRNAESFILEQLACKLTRHIIDPDVLIIEINDVGQEMFFISSGAVEVLVPVDGAYKQLVLLRDGSWFGEIAILRESRRTAAVNTVTTCDLFMLTKEDFLEIFEMFPDSTFRQAIVEEVEKRIKVLEPNEPEPEASPEMETPVVSIERGMSALVDSTVILDAMSDGEAPNLQNFKFGSCVGMFNVPEDAEEAVPVPPLTSTQNKTDQGLVLPPALLPRSESYTVESKSPRHGRSLAVDTRLDSGLASPRHLAPEPRSPSQMRMKRATRALVYANRALKR